jgi:hypothetical protein
MCGLHTIVSGVVMKLWKRVVGLAFLHPITSQLLTSPITLLEKITAGPSEE